MNGYLLSVSIWNKVFKIGANGNNHELLIKGESIKNYGEQKKKYYTSHVNFLNGKFGWTEDD